MTFATPIPFTPDVEKFRDDEAETITGLNESFDTILETTLADYGHAVRSVHAKAHGIVEGELEVSAGLPPELAQGMFATPGLHKCYLRISTNPGDILDDKIALPRGASLKVLDVDGERLPGAEGSTQDFLLVNGPVFTAPDAKKFSGNLKLLSKTTDKGEGAKVALSGVLQTINAGLTAVGLESSMLTNLGGAPQVDPLGETYYSTVPFRYGDFIAKFRLRPISPGLTALTGTHIDTETSVNAIREKVTAEMAHTDGEWAFEVQLCRDLEKQPVEDPTVEWKEDETPFQQVATVRIDRQDAWDADLVNRVEEQMRFSPWTGLVAHQPLGDINRARRDTYVHSSQFRASQNRCPLHEPTGRDDAAS